MNSWKVRGLPIFALFALAAVGGCAHPRDVATADSGAGTAHVHPPDSMRGMNMGPPIVIPKGAAYSEADVRFMQGMIHHHAQAIAMAHMAKSHGANPQLLTFTLKVDLSQRAEIDRMQWWLRDRNQTVPDTGGHHQLAMPGMLTAEQMKQLDAARGRDFDRLFLELMIQHHEGALTMVADLFAAPNAAQETEVFSLATDIRTDQTAEIEKMREMLRNL